MPVPKVLVLHLAEIVVAEKLLNFDEIAQVAAGSGVQGNAMDDICTKPSSLFRKESFLLQSPLSILATCTKVPFSQSVTTF